MSKDPDIFGLLLAAGSSSRLGSPKQLLEIHGKALINHTLSIALDSYIDDWLVVLGGNRDAILPKLDQQGYNICIFDDWEKGMGASLSAAVRYLKGMGISPKAYLILVCDQPYLSTGHINKLVEDWRKHHAIIASGYEGRMGVPAIIPNRFEPQLIRLNGDKGARIILKEHAEYFVSLPNGEFDLDTEADYNKYLKSRS